MTVGKYQLFPYRLLDSIKDYFLVDTNNYLRPRRYEGPLPEYPPVRASSVLPPQDSVLADIRRPRRYEGPLPEYPPVRASSVLPPQDSVLADIRRVADAHLARSENSPSVGVWPQSTLYLGVVAAFRATGDDRYLGRALRRAEALEWTVQPRTRSAADDHLIGQLYLELHEIAEDPRRIQSLVTVFDAIVERPTFASQVGWDGRLNWSWADALFMAPAAWAGLAQATGDSSYLGLMDTMWWETVGYLYDPEERLFYRDGKWIKAGSMGRSILGGRKVFWGRGNGWVLAGTARVLARLPDDFPNRPRYETLFRDMADRVVGLQQPDGLWRSDLTEPEAFPAPESSASGLITYALAWGVAEGVLDEARFGPAVARGYNGLRALVDAEGNVRWAEPPAQAPRSSDPRGIEPYATGAFLLTASEVVRLAGG